MDDLENGRSCNRKKKKGNKDKGNCFSTTELNKLKKKIECPL